MSKITIIEGNSNNKDNVRAIMVKGEKGEQGDLNHNDIIDNLTSTATDKVLSAKQGKVLKDLVDENTENISTNATNISTNATNISNEVSARQIADTTLQSQITGLASGSPLVASSTAGMTDTTRIYVNTTDGYWYYYNGTQWVQGGVYQASQNSDTLNYLENKVNEFIKEGTFNIVNQVEWESGSISTTTGNNNATPATAKRTVDYFDIPFNQLNVKKSSGFTLYVYRYNKTNHNFISADTIKQALTETTISLNNNEVYRFSYYDISGTETITSNLFMNVYKTVIDNTIKITPVENKAIITFIDDDESINFYNNIKPIFDNHNMKCSCAIVTDWVGENNRMSLSQIQELKTQGFEIVCHSKTHGVEWQSPGTSSISALRNDAQDSFDYLADNNLLTNIFVYPYGSGANWNTYGKNRVSKIIEQVGYDYGILAGGNDGINDKPLNNYKINRNFIDKTNSLSSYTDIIDSIVTNKQWVIFGTHSGNTSQIDSEYIDDILDYIDSLNSETTVVEVMTFSQALAYKQNILSKGIYEFQNYTYIDRDGNIYI